MSFLDRDFLALKHCKGEKMFIFAVLYCIAAMLLSIYILKGSIVNFFKEEFLSIKIMHILFCILGVSGIWISGCYLYGLLLIRYCL